MIVWRRVSWPNPVFLVLWYLDLLYAAEIRIWPPQQLHDSTWKPDERFLPLVVPKESHIPTEPGPYSNV